MNIRRDYNLYFVALFLCLGIVLNSGFVFPSCSNQPSLLRVTSGGNLVGEFDYSQISSGEVIYVRQDLGRYPLEIDFVFENIDSDCFSSENDIMIRLFPTGMALPASSLSPSENSTVAKFKFNIDAELPESFSSNYVIKNKNNPSGFESYINFGSDESQPVFSQIVISPSTPVLKSNATVKVDFVVTDSGSGLSSVSVANSNYGTTNLDGESSLEGEFGDTLTSSKAYTIKAVDMLGNTVSEEVSFLVDDQAPTIINLETEEYSRNSNSDRYVTLSVEVEDESFSLVNIEPQVYADLSSIASGKSRVGATFCNKVPLFEDKYVCVWENVVINRLNHTSVVNLPITAKDSIGNHKTVSLSHEIFYDNEGPEILEFYLENSEGIRNIFNSLDNGTFIFLKYNDESLSDDIRLIADFDGIEYYYEPDCDIKPGSGGKCRWGLEDSLSKYSGEPSGNLIYSVRLIDVYGNEATEKINITFNNVKPQIKDIEMFETTDIHDGVVNSKERINFRIKVSDDNLILKEDFIYADFYPIVLNEDYRKVAGTCSKYESLYQCDFNGIVVNNGHLLENVTFYVVDSAGNVEKENFLVEVLKIGDESPPVFKIEDINITNVLNRNVITQSGANAWFEGKIKYLEETPGSSGDFNPRDFTIVNYQLKSCNDSDMNPILLGDRDLYPKSIVSLGEDGNIERDFVLRTEVKTHPNMVDLDNDKYMKCTMSVLKRDVDTLYEPELVDFKINYDFYDLPQGTLLKAEAQKILDMAEDADFLGDWFDDVYEVYNFMNSACSLVSGANGVMAGVSNVWTFISWVISDIPPAQPVAKAGDTAIYKAFGSLTSIVNDKDSAVKKMCDFVTCRNGGLLGNFWSENLVGETFSSWKGGLDSFTAKACIKGPVPKVGVDFGSSDAGNVDETPQTEGDKTGGYSSE